MPLGINKVILIGHLGKDPEIHHFGDGKQVANFTMATSEKWKDKNTGQKQERVEWHNITAFGRIAEICIKYLKKGDPVYVEGKLKTEKYEDKKDGATKFSTKVIIHEMKMLGGRQSSHDSEDKDGTPSAASGEDFDDDIPF